MLVSRSSITEPHFFLLYIFSARTTHFVEKKRTVCPFTFGHTLQQIARVSSSNNWDLLTTKNWNILFNSLKQIQRPHTFARFIQNTLSGVSSKQISNDDGKNVIQDIIKYSNILLHDDIIDFWANVIEGKQTEMFDQMIQIAKDNEQNPDQGREALRKLPIANSGYLEPYYKKNTAGPGHYGPLFTNASASDTESKAHSPG